MIKIIDESTPKVIDPPINRITVSILIKRMFMYSAINKKAKLLAPYSILNPETSSDSPSAKSNGARFVSAKADINHINAKGIAKKEIQESA